jgi:hypothetical protein
MGRNRRAGGVTSVASVAAVGSVGTVIGWFDSVGSFGLGWFDSVGCSGSVIG